MLQVNNMYTGLKERSDNTHILLKELVEITDKYRRKLDSDRHEVINEFLDGKNEKRDFRIHLLLYQSKLKKNHFFSNLFNCV